MNDYIDQAHRTVSDKFYTDRVSLDALRENLKAFAMVADNLDRIKKALFYGKGELSSSAPDAEAEERAYVDFIGEVHPDFSVGINIVHGIIGKATECGEAVEALIKCIDGYAFDRINIIEEVGDGLWYDALVLKACGVDFDEAQRVNIAKLRMRFPEKFTEENANKRDLAAERATLERGS